MGLLSRLRYFFPTSTLLLLYYALVHPHLIYGLPLWGCTFPSYLQKLQILQNKALRLVSNTKNGSSITPIYYKFRILNISDLHAYEMAKLMHQYSTDSFFQNVSDIHGRNTRSSSRNRLYTPKFSTFRTQKSFKYQGSKIWNLTPANIRNMTFNKFKAHFKDIIIEKYSIN